MKTRRTLLATCPATLAIASGCTGFLSEPTTDDRTGRTTREPVFKKEDVNWHNDMFRGEIFTTPEELHNGINEDVFSKSVVADLTNFEPSESFVSVFASKCKLHELGTTKGWCPRTDIEDNKLLFHLPIETWPDRLPNPYENMVFIDRWQRNQNDPPSSTIIQVELLEEGEENTRTCSE